MIKSIEITNYKRIKHLEADNFNNINVIVGKSGVGKTSLLEAIYFAKHDRFIYPETSEEMMSPPIKYYSNEPIKVKLLETNSNNEENILERIAERVLKATDDLSNDDLCYFINDNMSNNIKQIILNKELYSTFMCLYSQISNDAAAMFIVGETVYVQLNYSDKCIPLSVMSKSFQKCVNIIAAVLLNKEIILIDNIENDLHFEDMKKLIEIIVTHSDKIQFFITSHSKEFLLLLDECLEKKKYNNILSVYNMYLDKENNVSQVQYTQSNIHHFMLNENEIRD